MCTGRVVTEEINCPEPFLKAQPQSQVLKNQRLREMCELPPQCFTETSSGGI